MERIDIELKYNNYNKIRCRESIYLDTNIWINISEPRNETDLTLSFVLEQLVNDTKIFCPLSFPIITELYKQSFNSMLKNSIIMDKLSIGFSFAMLKELARNEIVNLALNFDNQLNKIDIENIYVPIPAYLSSKGSITFPDEWDKSSIEKFLILFNNHLSDIKLHDMLESCKEYFIKRKEKDLSDALDKSLKDNYLKSKGDLTKIRKIEEDYFGNDIIVPLLLKLLTEERKPKFLEFLNKLPQDNNKRKLSSILEYLPVIKNQIDIYGITGLNPSKKIGMRDFYDLEHLFVALSYSNVFVSKDKWIKHILTFYKDIPSSNNCLFFQNENDLLIYLSNKYLKN